MQTTADILAAQALDPIIAWAEAERGRKSTLVRAVQEHSSATRNLIESWINPDPQRRKSPTLPNGLLLLAAAKEIGALPSNFQIPNIKPKKTTP